MAPSLRLLLGHSFSAVRSGNSLRQFYPVAAPPCQCRHFSQAPRLNGKPAGVGNIPRHRPPQPSMRTRARTVTAADLPQDLGLLPGTFVRPLWSEMPSISGQWNERLRMEWLWLKTWFTNFVGLLKYTYDNQGMTLGLKERREFARHLHKTMYTAFANGDIPTINRVCCPGLASDLTARINRRPKDSKITWSLESYRRTPSTFFTGVRIVSDRATALPEMPTSGIRQVIVRITSRQSKGVTQSSEKEKKKQSATSSEPAPAAPTTQNCVEYIVLQRLRWLGRNEPWRIWGYASPTTVENLSDPAFAPGLSVTERIEAMKQMAGGR